LQVKLADFTAKHGEKLLLTPGNSISFAITLNQFAKQQSSDITQLGAFLYSKRVMGSRIITDSMAKSQCGLEFSNYGSHINNYPNLPYMTVACAIGMTKEEIDIFIIKLDECFTELK